MRFNNLDLNLLVALDVLLREKSITKAADALNLSPSAVSNSLSRLRDFFDDQILAQIGRKMVVTPLGENLQISVRDILNRIDSELISKPVFDPAESERVFSILSSGYTQALLVSNILKLAEQQSSKVQFEFRQQIGHPQMMLERGEADFLIIPSVFVSPAHPQQVLFEEEFVCVFWSDNPISKVEFTLDTFNSASHIVLRPATGKGDYLENVIIKENKINRRIVASTYSFTAIPLMLIGTEHIAVVHKKLALKYAKFLPLEIRPLPLHATPMKQCIQWHKYRTNDPGMVWVKDIIAQAVALID